HRRTPPAPFARTPHASAYRGGRSMYKMHATRRLYAGRMDPESALKLRHLRHLVTVVDTGSFTDAAIELGVSQATVSRTLLALERILGVRVLHRTSRTVEPTTAGVTVLA